MRQRFSRFNQPIKCRGCGKLTTERVAGTYGLDMCQVCIREAELENEHLDTGHAERVEGCPTCEGRS